MKRRDPEVRQQRILDAALAEFAAHGMAGARVERIAQSADCSVGLLYRRFGSKEQLFEALYTNVVAWSEGVLLWDADDLPGYAGRVFDAQAAYPDVTRLALWRLLQDGVEPSKEAIDVSVLHEKLAEIREAQEAGRISARFDAPQLVLLTVAIASMWSTLGAELVALVPDVETRRQTVVEAVRRLVEP